MDEPDIGGNVYLDENGAPWLFYKHPDGQWVSLRRLDQIGVWNFAAQSRRVPKVIVEENRAALAEELKDLKSLDDATLNAWDDASGAVHIMGDEGVTPRVQYLLNTIEADAIGRAVDDEVERRGNKVEG